MKHVYVFMVVVLGLASAGLAGPAVSSVPTVTNPQMDPNADGAGARYGGTFTASQVGAPLTLNSTVSLDTPSAAVLEPVFDQLVEQNFVTGEIEPALAESWTVSQDKRTWTFRLRRGVKWHDGAPFTAADVDFTFRAIFTPGVPGIQRDRLTYEGKPLQWHVVDLYTVQFTTPKPAGIFLQQIGQPLFGVFILPRHKLEDALAKGGAEFARHWGVNTPAPEIVGTGPFMMSEYVPGQRVTYVRWSQYWKVDRKGTRLPYLTRYVRLIAPNPETDRQKFFAGEIDMYAARPHEFAELKAREREGNFLVYDGPETLNAEFVAFNQNPIGVAPPKINWFRDVRFRRALNHAIDRGTAAQQVYGGRATPGWGPISVGNRFYYNPNLRQYPYDIARAQQLLSEADYVKSPSGALQDPQGNTVAFTLSVDSANTQRVAIADIVRRDWQKLGIQVTVVPEAFSTLTRKITGSFNWEAIVSGLSHGIEPGTGRAVWLTSGSIHVWYPKQLEPATPWEAEMDHLIEKVAQESDQARRKQMYFRWQDIMADNVPLLYLTYPKTQPAVRNTFANVKVGLQGVVSPVILYPKEPSHR